MTSPIRIFIGTEPKTYIPLQVLKYSIQKHTTAEIEFHDLHGESWSDIKNSPLGSGTGFSILRWLIPNKCNYKGYAIYLDVDMLLFCDIAELWQQIDKLNNVSLACTYQKDKWHDKAPASSMMLLNNQLAKSQWQYHTKQQIEDFLKDDKKRKKYIALMHAQYIEPKPLELDISWNRFNNYKTGTKILHYTEEPKQPWYDPKHPNKDLWRDYFVECLQLGLINKKRVEDEIARFQPASSCCRAEGLHPYWGKFLSHAKIPH